MEVSSQFQTPAALSQKKKKIQQSIFSSWTDPRASLDTFGKQNNLLTLAEYKVSINMKDRQIEKRFQNFFEL
jgi:hypothetical protein